MQVPNKRATFDEILTNGVNVLHLIFKYFTRAFILVQMNIVFRKQIGNILTYSHIV